MDAYQQQQQPHRYMRPPPPQQPPAPADPHLQQQPYYQYQPPPPRAAAPPPPGSWYSNQFQFQYQQQHNQSHSAPPHHPPSPQQPPSQWGPPPHPDHSAYPPPPPPHLPFPPHTHNGSNHFPTPPPPPPVPRPYMPPSQIPNTFSHVNQEWSNPNWSHHQAHTNVEDWGAKAREWANTRAAMQDQPVQSQITPAGRPEEQNHFRNPYSQAADSHYMDAQQSLPTSSYQQFPVPAASPHGPPATYPTETLSNSTRPSSYVPDGCPPYHVGDGTSLMDPNSGFLHQESLPASSSVHLQEVPSSYSSVSGKEKSADEKEQSYKSLPLPISSAKESAYHVQPPLPDIGRSVLSEQSLSYGNQIADPAADLRDRPFDFAPRFNNDHERQMQSNYAVHHESLGRGIDPIAISSSINSWTPPVAPDQVYPPVLPPGAQHDPLSAPSPISGHMASSFPRFPGPSFQPHIPSATAPFALGVGAQLHPTAAFPADAYGAISERPKKGPVPNWLKEEILRNKATIAKSSLEHPKETESIEDEAVDKSLAKNDQADSKSIDSSRSTEEDDDEDYVEAARTAAINQEIKRVLTEVLLKVTDELFCEIATKVVNEDDPIVEVDRNSVASKHMVSPSSSLVPTPKASARVLVPGKAKEPDTAAEKPSSSSPGNVLGLANYASDDEDVDGEIQSSRMTYSRSNEAVVQSSTNKLSEDNDLTENGNSQAVLVEHREVEKNLGSDMKSKNRSHTTDDRADRNYEKLFSSKVVSGYESNINSGKLRDGNNGSKMTDTLGGQVTKKSNPELPGEYAGKKSTKAESQDKEMRGKLDKNDRHEIRNSTFSKDPGSGRELEVIRSRGEQKGDENYMREEEKLGKQKIEDRNGSKEREKEPKPLEKAKESDSRKRPSHHDAKDDKKDADRSNRASAKEDVGRKRERTNEDRSRHKRESDSSRHKRRRSSSISSRGRKSKDNSSDHTNESSDETSDSSKRKSRSRKRSSPSPIKSRRRQVLRSPHSKNSQRRHSSYSSSETTRGRRSRSRSPVRR